MLVMSRWCESYPQCHKPAPQADLSLFLQWFGSSRRGGGSRGRTRARSFSSYGLFLHHFCLLTINEMDYFELNMLMV